MSQSVMIIEDDELSRLMYSEVLMSENYEVVQLENAGKALHHLQSNPAPDLILMDLNFEGLPPEDFVAKLKQNPATSAIPFILISGQSTIAQRALKMQALAYLKKPFDLDDFIDIVKKSI